MNYVLYFLYFLEKLNFKIALNLTLVLTFVLSIGCSDKDENYYQNSEFFYQLTPEEQINYAPTSLFRSIYQNDFNQFELALEENKANLTKTNFENDTALAAAIKLQRTDLVPLILERMTLDELKTPNLNGRSFVSLFAEFDDLVSFETIQRKYQNQIGFFGNLDATGEAFSNFDFPDNYGRNAAHYVQSKVFLDQLSSVWFLRAADALTIWSDLYYHTDIDGNTFIHAAANYNKFDIIQWFTEQHCGSQPGEGQWWITRQVDSIIWGAGKAVQYLQVSDYTPLWRKFINTVNNEENTSLHIAAAEGHYQSVAALMRCPEINPVMINLEGQIPLSHMLSHLDVHANVINENYKTTFNLIMNQINPMTLLPTYDFKYYTNLQDLSGRNAIFYASLLNDKYFYNELNKYNLNFMNQQGVSPRDSQ